MTFRHLLQKPCMANYIQKKEESRGQGDSRIAFTVVVVGNPCHLLTQHHRTTPLASLSLTLKGHTGASKIISSRMPLSHLGGLFLKAAQHACRVIHFGQKSSLFQFSRPCLSFKDHFLTAEACPGIREAVRENKGLLQSSVICEAVSEVEVGGVLWVEWVECFGWSRQGAAGTVVGCFGRGKNAQGLP